MFRKAMLIAFTAAVAGGLMASATGGAEAAVRPAVPCATSTVIQIESFAFHPAAVAPGGSSTATLAALNCTDQTQQTSEIWSGRFTGPSGAIPPGCPVIDPIALPVTFPPGGSVATSVTYLVPPSCTASELVVTVDIDGQGRVLAHGTAVLTIISPVAGARAGARH
jgi:hypothetical protein